MLLEVIVGLVIVTIVMTALTGVLVTNIRSTSHQRAEQAAVRLVTEQADSLRALAADVIAERAEDRTIAVGETEYLLSTQVSNCYQQVGSGVAGADTSCDILAAPPETGEYATSLRITMTATWDDGTCGADGCSYGDSIVVNAGRDPVFPVNDEPPPSPVLSGCRDQVLTVGQQINMDVRGPQIACEVKDGLGPLTWGIDSLPAGLSVATNGLVTGTVTAAAGSITSSTVTVTDVYLRKSTDVFTWTVLPPLMDRSLWLRSDRTDLPLKISLKNFINEGVGNYRYDLADGVLPPGLSLDPATGLISGKYDKATGGESGDYPITIKMTDTAGNVTFARFMYYVRSSAGQPQGNGMALCPTAPLDYRPQIVLTSNPPPCSIPGHNLPGNSPASSVVELKVNQPIAPFNLWDNAYGQISPYTFKKDPNAPTWIKVDLNTGVVTGTPQAITTLDWERNVQFQVYDAVGSYTTVTVYWRVIQ